MADGKRIYQIQINGVQESIDAVKTLTNQLNDLEKKIKNLESKAINIKTSGSGGSSKGTSNNASLSQEAALEKEINSLKNEGIKLDAKIEAAQSEIYKRVQATKDVYKETLTDQKSLAAQERLQADAYSNTMQGIKDKLADLKAVINTTDFGDSDAIKKMTEEANKLTNKLKEMEEAYGQFGRNVGNYQSAFEGMEKISVIINGVTQEFNNLRQAQRALTNAMGTLEMNGKKDTDMYKQMEKELEKVAKAQLRLNSAMNDAKSSSKAMDDMLDTFESLTALQQVGQGFSTFFGIDNSALEQQIAKLVALQNVLQGIEKIRQQMNTGEGIGEWFKNSNIDNFVANLGGAEVRMGKIIASTKQASIVMNGFATAIKMVAGALKALALIGAVSMIGDLVQGLFKWANGGISASDATNMLNKRLEKLIENYDKIDEILKKNLFNGLITSEEYARESTQKLIQSIGELTKEFATVEYEPLSITMFTPEEAANLRKSLSGFKNITKEFVEMRVEEEATDKALKKILEDLKVLSKRDNYVKNALIPSIAGPVREIKTFFKGEGREIDELGKQITENFVFNIIQATRLANQEIAENGRISDITAQKIKNLREQTKKPEFGTVFDEIGKFSEKGEYYGNVIKSVTTQLEKLADKVSADNIDPSRMAQLQIDAMKDGLAKQRKQIELNRKKELADAGENLELINAINAKYDRQRLEAQKAHNKEMAQAYADLANIRIQMMREGWAKEQATLRQERDERIRQVVESEQLVGKRVSALRELYRQKELDAERDWAYEVLKINEELYNNIEAIEREAYSKEASTAEQNITNKQSSRKNTLWESVITPENKLDVNSRKQYYDEILKIDLEASKKQQSIREENLWRQLEYDKKDEEERHKTIADAKTYSLVMGEMTKIPEPTDDDYAKIEAKLRDELRKMRGELVDAYNEGKLDFKTFTEYLEKEQNAHNATMNALNKEYNSQLTASTQQALDEQKQLYNNYYTNLIAAVRTNQDKVNEKMSKMPNNKNDWGVVQISSTKRVYEESLKEAQDNATKLNGIKTKLKNDLVMNKISYEDWFMRDQELDAAMKANEQTIENIKQKQKNIVADFIQSIQTYLQTAVQSFNTIMSAIWDAQDVAFDKEQEQIDKQTEELEKALDKQRELTEQYANDVNSIEDELKTARGDRRQQLIDNLNAEMAAQRASLAQEKKIEKEQEKLKQKEEELDKKRKKAEYERNMIQAIVNGAMAVTMAAINTWPIPAIPMMALAASTTAAQIAIMAANKPYAKGGVLEGPSHAQGGIPVGNTGIEVEGKEYIIRKKSTTPNVEVLDYINRSERKLNLSDFIDFYSNKSNNVKKVIANASPRAKFAEGGLIPSMRTDIEFNDRLMQSFEDYSNRPVTVSVVEINNKQEAVRNVQVLSGLET